MGRLDIIELLSPSGQRHSVCLIQLILAPGKSPLRRLFLRQQEWTERHLIRISMPAQCPPEARGKRSREGNDRAPPRGHHLPRFLAGQRVIRSEHRKIRSGAGGDLESGSSESHRGDQDGGLSAPSPDLQSGSTTLERKVLLNLCLLAVGLSRRIADSAFKERLRIP